MPISVQHLVATSVCFCAFSVFFTFIVVGLFVLLFDFYLILFLQMHYRTKFGIYSKNIMIVYHFGFISSSAVAHLLPGLTGPFCFPTVRPILICSNCCIKSENT